MKANHNKRHLLATDIEQLKKQVLEVTDESFQINKEQLLTEFKIKELQRKRHVLLRSRVTQIGAAT